MWLNNLALQDRQVLYVALFLTLEDDVNGARLVVREELAGGRVHFKQLHRFSHNRICGVECKPENTRIIIFVSRYINHKSDMIV